MLVNPAHDKSVDCGCTLNKLDAQLAVSIGVSLRKPLPLYSTASEGTQHPLVFSMRVSQCAQPNLVWVQLQSRTHLCDF
jgi:hypothetical protein